MKRLLILLPFLLLFTIAACAGNSDENEVRGIVGNFERTLESAIGGNAKPAALEAYFATIADGANEQGLVNTRDAYASMLNNHVSGASLVQLSNFRITNVEVHQSSGLAKVTYQMDIRIVHGTNQGTATLTQDFALLKTPRGWRISGGDPWRYSNVVGTLP